MSRTFLAVLQYDGRDFVGWQRQKSGRSVQGEFEQILTRLTGEQITAHASGRTDAGVHAVGMGVSFTAPDQWTPADFHRALNGLLPRDCWVQSVQRMQDGFHARKCAIGRRYRYDVGCDAEAWSPFRRPYEWPFGRPLDADRLQRAAELLVGEHDFVAFAAKGTAQRHFRCVVEQAEWRTRSDGRGFSFHVAADRFLYRMVRMLVGTMIDIGSGRRAPEDMEHLLVSSDNSDTSPPAPPQGLYFLAADYPSRWYLEPSA
ncbi:MAG: tRNA pseudouridine(38-40) synthase TruA [Gemmatimonadales bacterium]